MSPSKSERQNESTQGLRPCRQCGVKDFLTVSTRDAAKNQIRRRKECRNCGNRITTFEAEAGN